MGTDQVIPKSDLVVNSCVQSRTKKSRIIVQVAVLFKRGFVTYGYDLVAKKRRIQCRCEFGNVINASPVYFTAKFYQLLIPRFDQGDEFPRIFAVLSTF